MPPPSLSALLPERVLFVTVSVPLVVDAAAAVPVALLPERVLFVTVSVPWLIDAAAVRRRALPCWIVRLLRLTVFPLFTAKTVTLCSPSTSRPVPLAGPVIVTLAASVSVPLRVVVSVIVPVQRC